MLVYLDSVLIFYQVEGDAEFGPRAASRLQEIGPAGDRPAFSLLTCLECVVKPLREGDRDLVDGYDELFTSSYLIRLPVTEAVFERATSIAPASVIAWPMRLHLATAAIHGCGLFLTNDRRLEGFPDVPVEILS